MRFACASLLLLLLAPAASARGEVRGEVSFASPALPQGRVVLSSPDGGLDLSEAARHGEPLSLSWAAASGNLIAYPWRTVTDPTGEAHSVAGAPSNHSLAMGPGTLRSVSCAGPCEVLLLGPVGMEGAADGPLRWLEEDSAHWGSSSAGAPDSFSRAFRAGAFAASSRGGEDATRLRDAAPRAEGGLFLFLKNGTVVLEALDGARLTLDARERASTTADAPGLARAEEVEERFALLRLTGASFSAPPGGSARFLAERPVVALDGRLSAAVASGRLEHAGVARAFDGEPILLEGRLTLLPRVSPRPGGAIASLLEPPTLRARVEGDADRVQVGGVPVGGAPAAPVPAAAAGATGAAALLAVLWTLQRALLAPLYSRIGRGRALVNQNRARLHRLICEEPGITAAELRRRVGLARMVVRHHLQLLEAHGLVTRRVDGRKQRYFSTDEPASDVRASPRFLLEAEGRRRVFDALASSAGPLTQRELAERTGLSQRLVSYHLARLEEAGGVVADASLPRRYAARPEWVSRGRWAAS